MSSRCSYLIQMNELAETSELLAFVKAVEMQSVSRAASELGVPRATISRRLARLEEHLGVRLLHRTTRSLSLTDAGEVLYGNARLALDAVEQAEESVRRTNESIRGSLRVSLPPHMDASFYDLVCRFRHEHPEVDLHLHFSSEYVDLKREGYHLALRASSELEPGLIARTLSRAPLLAVASPAYLRAQGSPRSTRDLRQHRCLLGFVRGEIPQTHWPLLRGGKVRVQGALAANDLSMLHHAARAGLGIALLPLQVVSSDLKRGELVHVLAKQLGSEARIALVYAEKEFIPPQVRAFIDAVVAWSPGRFEEGETRVCAEVLRQGRVSAVTPRSEKKKSPALKRAGRRG